MQTIKEERNTSWSTFVIVGAIFVCIICAIFTIFID